MKLKTHKEQLPDDRAIADFITALTKTLYHTPVAQFRAVLSGELVAPLQESYLNHREWVHQVKVTKQLQKCIRRRDKYIKHLLKPEVWQPITTVPRGVRILVYNNQEGITQALRLSSAHSCKSYSHWMYLPQPPKIIPIHKVDFIYECHTRLISPEIALENENVKAAIHCGDLDRLAQVLNEEF